MKALCNMKVNGRWVKAGEEYGIPAQVRMDIRPSATEPETPADATTENAETKPVRKRTSRKKSE